MDDKTDVATIIKYEKGVPTIACFRNDPGSLTFVCPACGNQHYHGAGDVFGEGDGHRSSHCDKMRDGGYYLKESKDWKDAGYLHKYDRDESAKRKVKKKLILKTALFQNFRFEALPTITIFKNTTTVSVRWDAYNMPEDRLFGFCVNKKMEDEMRDLWHDNMDILTNRSEWFYSTSSGTMKYIPSDLGYKVFDIAAKYYRQALFRMVELGYLNDTDYYGFDKMCNIECNARELFGK